MEDGGSAGRSLAALCDGPRRPRSSGGIPERRDALRFVDHPRDGAAKLGLPQVAKSCAPMDHNRRIDGQYTAFVRGTFAAAVRTMGTPPPPWLITHQSITAVLWILRIRSGHLRRIRHRLK